MKEFNGEKFYSSLEVNKKLETYNHELLLNELTPYYYFNGFVNGLAFNKKDENSFIKKNSKNINESNSLDSIEFKKNEVLLHIKGFFTNNSRTLKIHKNGNYISFDCISFKQSQYSTIIKDGDILSSELSFYPTNASTLIGCAEIDLYDFFNMEEKSTFEKIIQNAKEIHSTITLEETFLLTCGGYSNLSKDKIPRLITSLLNPAPKQMLTRLYNRNSIIKKAKLFRINNDFSQDDFDSNSSINIKIQGYEISKQEHANRLKNFRGERNLKLALYAMASLLAEENEEKYKHKSSKKINVAEIAKHIASYLEENKEDFVKQPRLKSGYFATEYGKIKKDLSNYIEQALTDIEEEI